ncbi:MAG: amino acid ABC transporter permease [Treponema sp.]|jgi:ABC-type amino acid transport system permease subunit|nr:amino acid ABC transporter permease [Treponema sp.]
MYRIDYNFLLSEIKTGFLYLPFTLFLATGPLVIGFVIGGILALIRVQRVPVISEIIRWYTVFIRGLPMVLILLIVYFAFVSGFDLIMNALNLPFKSGQIPPVLFAFIILSFISTALITESIRMALLSVPPGQIEAAQSIGMTTPMIYRRVIVPQAMPVAVPILGNTFIGQIKGTALVSMIGVKDIVTQVRIAANANYRYLEAYIAVAIVYWIVCVGIEQGIRLLDRKIKSRIKGAVL